MNSIIATIRSDKHIILRRGDEHLADIYCDYVKNEVTVIGTHSLTVYYGRSATGGWQHVSTYWPDEVEDRRDVVSLSSGVEPNYKGLWCYHGHTIICQEGYCSNCELAKVKP
jgi:hypothetical protein